MQGQVKWFNNSKGYGFIGHEGGPDVFVHYTAIVGAGYRTLSEGEPVEFEIAAGPTASRQRDQNGETAGWMSDCARSRRPCICRPVPFYPSIENLPRVGQRAGGDEELRQAPCCFLAPGGVNRWFIRGS